MNYNKYSIDEIEIGGEVFFDNVYRGNILVQSNYEEYWIVHGKKNDSLLINLREEHYWSIKPEEIRQYLPPRQ